MKGKHINLKALLDDSSQAWQSLTVNWYGGEQKIIECLSFVCLWYHAGEPPLSLRIVLVKTPGGKHVAETFFSTEVNNLPLQIINWFVLRWNIEICQSYYLHKNKVDINLPFLPVNDKAILADDFLTPLAA